MQSLDKVKEWEKARDSKSEGGTTYGRSSLVYYLTHFNLFLYAACFFIQSGTLPVRTETELLVYIHKDTVLTQAVFSS